MDGSNSDADPAGDGNAREGGGEGAAPFVRLSKAEKRKLKYERKRAARQAQHKRMKVQRQQKRAEDYSRMTEEEKREEREERRREEDATRAHLEKCFHEGQRVAVDMSFSSLPADALGDGGAAGGGGKGSGSSGGSVNSERETNSLATQLMHLYSSIKRRECSLSLHLVSYTGGVAERLDRHGAQGWRCHRHAGSLAEVFPPCATSAAEEGGGAGEDTAASSSSSSASAASTGAHSSEKPVEVCYLTPDADEELLVVDPAVVYVVGGIVDRTVTKGLSKSRAVS